MSYQIPYLVFINLLGLLSGICFIGMRKAAYPYKIRIKKNRYIQFKDYIISRIENQEVEKLLQQSGTRVSFYQYQFVRYSVFLLWIILSFIFYQIIKVKYDWDQLLILLILFILTSPKAYFFGRRTPFKCVIDIFTTSYKNKLNIELYRCISQLKNIAITKKNNSLNSDFLLEQLSKFTKVIKPVFNKMVALWSIGKKEESCSYFKNVIGTKEAEQLSNLFRKLDDLSPYQLYEQIDILQEAMKKERVTNKLTANENKSNMIYLFVILTSAVIMINFVVVVYYLETLHQIQMFY